jgi:hypothetical protein
MQVLVDHIFIEDWKVKTQWCTLAQRIVVPLVLHVIGTLCPIYKIWQDLVLRTKPNVGDSNTQNTSNTTSCCLVFSICYVLVHVSLELTWHVLQVLRLHVSYSKMLGKSETPIDILSFFWLIPCFLRPRVTGSSWYCPLICIGWRNGWLIPFWWL